MPIRGRHLFLCGETGDGPSYLSSPRRRRLAVAGSHSFGQHNFLLGANIPDLTKSRKRLRWLRRAGAGRFIVVAQWQTIAVTPSVLGRCNWDFLVSVSAWA